MSKKSQTPDRLHVDIVLTFWNLLNFVSMYFLFDWPRIIDIVYVPAKEKITDCFIIFWLFSIGTG